MPSRLQLQSMTDQMAHSGANFTCVVRVWSGQHRDRCQVRLIVGEDNTMERKTREALLQAWCVWHVVRLCPRHVPEVRWCFTPAGFDETLQRLQPPLRTANLQRCAVHARECPRCKNALLVLGDGKRGACRFICGGADGSVKHEDLHAAVYSGCCQHVGGGTLLRRGRRPSATPQSALLPQRRVLRSEVMEDEESGNVTTRYDVECENPGGCGEVFECLLPRKKVRRELLQSFETGTFASEFRPAGQAAETTFLQERAAETASVQKCPGSTRSFSRYQEEDFARPTTTAPHKASSVSKTKRVS